MDEAAPKRGRKPDPVYEKLVELFLDGGDDATEIAAAAMGRTPSAAAPDLLDTSLCSISVREKGPSWQRRTHRPRVTLNAAFRRALETIALLEREGRQGCRGIRPGELALGVLKSC